MIETVAGRYGAVELVRAEQEDLYSDGYMSFDEMDGLSGESSLHSTLRPLPIAISTFAPAWPQLTLRLSIYPPAPLPPYYPL